MKKLVIYLLLSIFSISALIAQYGQSSRNCILCSVEIGGGWYQPSLDYWNDESYLSEINGSFNGGIIGVVSAEFKIYEGFMGGVQAGYWSDVAEVANAGPIANWNEKVAMAIIPITLFGKYEFSFAPSRLYPFVGLGYSMNFLNQDITREVGGVLSEISLEGTTQTASLMAGLKFAVFPNVDAGLEYSYVLGTFDQDFVEDEVQTTQAVGLDGSLIVGKISFTIDDRINPQRRGRPGGGNNRKYKPGKSRKNSFKRPGRRKAVARKPKRRGGGRKSSSFGKKRRGR